MHIHIHMPCPGFSLSETVTVVVDAKPDGNMLRGGLSFIADY